MSMSGIRQDALEEKKFPSRAIAAHCKAALARD